MVMTLVLLVFVSCRMRITTTQYIYCLVTLWVDNKPKLVRRFEYLLYTAFCINVHCCEHCVVQALNVPLRNCISHSIYKWIGYVMCLSDIHTGGGSANFLCECVSVESQENLVCRTENVVSIHLLHSSTVLFCYAWMRRLSTFSLSVSLPPSILFNNEILVITYHLIWSDTRARPSPFSTDVLTIDSTDARRRGRRLLHWHSSAWENRFFFQNLSSKISSFIHCRDRWWDYQWE